MGYVLRFGVFELNLVTEELRKFGTPLKLAPQPFKVLALLASQAGQVVTREQIQFQVWGDETYVDFEQGLNHCIKQIRNALGDSADIPRYIETLPRRGYRFIAPVEARGLPGDTPEITLTLVEPEVAPAPTAMAAPAVEGGGVSEKMVPIEPARWASTTTLAIAAASLLLVTAIGYLFVRSRTRPASPPVSWSPTAGIKQRKSVAVLGFQNVSGYADAAWYSTAFSEMLRTELAAGETLRIVEGESVDRMKADLHLADTDSLAKDTLQRVQKMVGADYVVLGSYTDLGKDAGGRIRLDLRLQDTRSGETIASVAESGTVDEIFDLVSRAGESVRPKLGLAAITNAEASTVRAMLPANPDAARFYSQALAKLRVFDAPAGRDLLQRSIAVEPYFAPAHSALAAAWKMMGYERDAREEAQKAFKLASNLPREEQVSAEARYREMSAQWDEAIRLYQSLRHDFPDNVDYGLRLASAQKSGNQAKAALATVESLRQLPPPAGEDPRIDLAEASVAYALGDLALSQQAATRAAEQSKSLGSSHILARARTAQAKVFFDQGQLGDALNLFRQSLVIYKQVDDASGETASLSNIASVLQVQGDPGAALGMYEKALALYLKIGDKSSAALTLNDMGAVFQRQRNFDAAQKAYQQSLDLYRELGDKLNQSAALHNMGEVRYSEGDLGGSMTMEERALALARESGNPQAAAAALADLGQVLASKGDLAASRKAQEEALRIATESGDTDSADDSRLALAELSLADGRWQDAEAAGLKLVEQAHQKKQAEREAAALAVVTRALLAEGKPSEANAAFARAKLLTGEVQDPALRLDLQILAARVGASSGKPEDQAEALDGLTRTLAEAKKGGFVVQAMEAALALGVLEIEARRVNSGHSRLQALEKEAASRGFVQIAKQAAAARKVSG